MVHTNSLLSSQCVKWIFFIYMFPRYGNESTPQSSDSFSSVLFETENFLRTSELHKEHLV